VGAATYVKLATNMIAAAEIEVLAEALALLNRGGVPLPRLVEALEHNLANSGTIALKLPLMLKGEFAPRFSVKNMLKDLQIVLHAVEGKNIDLPATAATAGALMGAVQAGWGEDDFASVARHYPYSGSLKELAIEEASAPEVLEAEDVTTTIESEPVDSKAEPEKKKLYAFLGRRGRANS